MAGQNETLAWGGGTPVQVVFGHGTLTSAGANTSVSGVSGLYSGTLTDTSQSWSTTITNYTTCPDGYFVKFTSGSQAGNVFMVSACTATTLTLLPGFAGTLPSIGDAYTIYYPEVTLTDNSGGVQGYLVTNQGYGYTSTPTASLSGGNGSGAGNPTVVLSNGCVASLTPGAAGTGYTTAPTVAISGGGGSSATALALLGTVQAGIDPRSLPSSSQTDTGITIAFHDVTSNPLVANLSGSTPADFELQAGSPEIDAGSSTNGVTTDYFGRSRPQGAGWDIGFYEASGGASFFPRGMSLLRPLSLPTVDLYCYLD